MALRIVSGDISTDYRLFDTVFYDTFVDEADAETYREFLHAYLGDGSWR